MADTTPTADDAGSQVRELITERDRLRDWLERLDDIDDETPAHIAARVRTDYARRLEQLTDELASHVQTVRDNLEAARGRLQEAEEASGQSRDRLEEVRLRHRIGELDADEWDERRPELEAARAAAEESRDRTAGEVEALTALLQEIEASPAASGKAEEEPDEEWEPVIVADEGTAAGEDDADREFEAAFEALSADDRIPGAGDARAPDEAAVAPGEEEEAEDLPWLSEIDEEISSDEDDVEERATRKPAVEDEPEETGDDLAFLEELDRAIAASETTRGAEDAPAIDDDGEVARPPVGAKTATIPCPECAAENDARSWYCEVCGAELA